MITYINKIGYTGRKLCSPWGVKKEAFQNKNNDFGSHGCPNHEMANETPNKFPPDVHAIAKPII